MQPWKTMTLRTQGKLGTRADKLYEEAENLEFVISELEER
jgi:hypothetical protein